MPDQAPTTPANEQMVSVKVDHETRSEPISKVVASYQTQSTAEKRLAEANALLQSRKAQVAFAEHFQTALRTGTPEMALEDLRSQLERQIGRQIKPAGSAVAGSDGGNGLTAGEDVANSAHTIALQNRIQALETALNADRQTRTVEKVEGEVQSAIGQYPMFKTEAGQKIRGIAEMALKGLRVANPDVPASDLASELHAGLQELMTAQATSQHTQLTAQAAALAGVPATAGSPALTDREPPPSVDMVRKGGAREYLTKMLGNIQRQASQNAR